MVPDILPSHLKPIHNLWTNQTQSPEVDQEVVEVQPLLVDHSLGHVHGGSGVRPQGDPLKVLGFNGLEGGDDPPYAWPCALKCQAFEFRGHGEVKQSPLGSAHVHWGGVG